jgi:hypothetical protein
MIPEGERIGLIAGRGAFPIHFADAAQNTGHPITALAIEGYASPELAEHVDEIVWLGVGQVDRLIKTCHARNISRLAMAGKIDHVRVLNPGKLDRRAWRLLLKLRDRRAESIVAALIKELMGENIQVIDSTYFLKSLLPSVGLMTRRRPLNKREQRDVAFALPLARELARLDIGMSLVVKERSIVAVEGMDGTDETIRRGGRLAGPGTVVVKASRPRQDFRFDLPILGLSTVQTMAEAGATALAFCADETIFFDHPQAIALAESSNIGIIALAPPVAANASSSSKGEPQP